MCANLYILLLPINCDRTKHLNRNQNIDLLNYGKPKKLKTAGEMNGNQGGLIYHIKTKVNARNLHHNPLC